MGRHIWKKSWYSSLIILCLSFFFIHTVYHVTVNEMKAHVKEHVQDHIVAKS